jgi:Contractile injection system tube protein
MPDRGNLEKMLILAFDNAKDAETGTLRTSVDHFEALINPESYSIDYKIDLAKAQGPGTSGTEARYAGTRPEELTFDFLFDNTGLIDNAPKPDGVFDDVTKFRQLLTKFRSGSHETHHLKLVWGNLVFKGRAAEVGVSYKLFNPDGQPIRAVVRVKFTGSMDEQKRAAVEARRSPDLTHQRNVRPGDTLPLLCFQVYGDPRHYLFVAEANRLDDFRRLPVGRALVFPPLPKEVAR